MDFAYSDKVKALQGKLARFMDAHVYPNERRFRDEVEANRAKGNPWVPTKLIEELKPKARAEGLWNLFLPRSPRAPEGLANLEYAPCAKSWGACTGRRKCSTAPRPIPATWRRWNATAPRSKRGNGSIRCFAARFARPSL